MCSCSSLDVTNHVSQSHVTAAVFKVSSVVGPLFWPILSNQGVVLAQWWGKGRVCHVRSPRAAGVGCWRAEESPRVPVDHNILQTSPVDSRAEQGLPSLRHCFLKQPKYEYNIEILFCGNCNLQLPLSFGMRMYGSGKEVTDLAARQALAVNGNRWHGLHGSLGWERMRSDHVPASGTMAGEASIKVWNACSTVETQTFHILPVVTPSELTFSLSWEGIPS